MESILSIKQFWFGADADARTVSARQSDLWWSKNARLDQQLRSQFGATVAAAAQRELDDWARSADGLLALVLLTDQFPRNIYRDHSDAFALDTQARDWCRLALTRKADLALRPLEQVFLYLPLEHSEHLADQEQSVRLFQALLEQAPASEKELFRGFLDFAQRHHAIIARFGRFPHRNAILQRRSSPDELVFLQQPNSSF